MTTHRAHAARSSPCLQQGLTLIELMVGLLIGMLVSLAAVTSLGFSRLASSTVGDSTRLHEDASTAFRIIGHHMRQAGAQRLLNAGGGRVHFNAVYVGYGSAANPHALEGVNAPNGPDTLRVSHDIEPLITATDCLGNAPTKKQQDDGFTTLSNVFSVVNGSLQCAGSAENQTASLIQGVEDFQVRYAVRDSATDTLQYRDAPVDWNAVEGVMVCLQLVGELGGQPTAPVVGCDGNPTAQDGRVRRAFWRVFQLRNADA
ncbi:MAG: PilW family protein [Hydrogenophaga sp.]|jgi:type IV pilus assembly protein PilW|uniref:PilW family protein n=1 Tax=Hydrogenophaga sp. TaxID=1904254 RepID=UPI0026337B40|nr:PilW family protein [Hydrogenophaga sp.]MCV0438660.1 PilW family protein [Hydrogenophaga sp.]